MRFNINPKELLALHNLLFEKFESEQANCFAKEYMEGDPRAAPDAQLRQVYGRLKAVLLGALSGRGVQDPIDQVFKREQAKIDRLRLLEELDDEVPEDEADDADVKKSSVDSPKKAFATHKYDPDEDEGDHILKLDPDDDVFAEPYPRKGSNPRGPRGGGRNKR